jgi:hypothetical protein
VTLGTIYLEQRDWPQALDSYQKALEWKEKTGRHHKTGDHLAPDWHGVRRAGDFVRSTTDVSKSVGHLLQYRIGGKVRTRVAISEPYNARTFFRRKGKAQGSLTGRMSRTVDTQLK